MTFIFFNLLINSILSLMGGLILVYFFLWFFRVQAGRWKLFILSLPFAKIIYDLVRGVPEKSILFSDIDPFSLPPKQQILSIGAGFDGWRPVFSTVFSVNGLDGKTYNSSIGDYLVIWIHRKFGTGIPLAIVSSVLAVSTTLLLLRIIHGYSFEKKRKKDRLESENLKVQKLGFRVIDIYISKNFSGTPFTGGIVKPYICIPYDAKMKLSENELDVVIAHELGHVFYFDLLLTILIQGLGDIFWFIPGYRWLSRKIDRLREIVADQAAINTGNNPSLLASALVKLKEIPEPNSRFILYSAFFREKSLLKERIERLLGNIKENESRWGWQSKWIRYVTVVFISMLVMNSSFGGNYGNEAIRKIPEWLEKFLTQILGT